MKKQYVSKTLGEFIGESNSITLKRKYTDARPAVVVGVNAPLRNQVLSYVAESGTVAKAELKQFILGLKEGGASVAAANMFIKRNAHYFVTESKNGMTYFKLSNLGQRLVNQFVPKQEINEDETETMPEIGYEEAVDIEASEGPAEDVEFEEQPEDDEKPTEVETDQFEYEEDDDKIVLTYYKNPSAHKAEEEAEGEEDFDHNDEETEDENLEELEEDADSELNDDDEDDADFSKYDFIDKGRPGIYDMDESLDENSGRIERMKQIIENLKSKRENILNEADEADELTDADLDTIDTGEKEGEEKPAEDKETDTALDGDENMEKVEITEFIITVDDVDSAIDELAELGVTAERVPVEKTEEEVPAPEETEEKPVETEEKPAETEEKPVEATKESLQRFIENLLNEEESSDELGLGDQGEEAKELEEKPAEESPEGEEDLLEPTQEFEENKIKVQAKDWDTLKGWLEQKGVDVKEMFGGDIEVEEFDTEDDAAAAVKGEEISDDDIDFSGIGDKDETLIKNNEIETKDKK